MKKNGHALLFCSVCKIVVGCAHRADETLIYLHRFGCTHDVKTFRFFAVDSDVPVPDQKPPPGSERVQ